MRLVTCVFLCLVLATYGFVGLDESQSFAAASDNIAHVKQLVYEDVTGDGANQGTDLEFATLTLSGRSVAELARRSGERPRQGGLGDADPDTPGIQRTYAFAGSYDNGLQIIDVTDPARAEIVAVYGCGISQGDVQVFSRDSDPGRTFVTYTQDDGYGTHESQCIDEARELGLLEEGQAPAGTFIADVTDPYAPTTVSWVEVPKGSHNQTVHPSGRYLYNSNSDLIVSVPDQGIEVFDISDFGSPEHVTTLALPVRPGLGTESHDLTFNADGTRAYSAALSQTVIIDTEDPADPSIVSSFVDPAINVEHQADPVTLEDPLLGERDFLVIEDEVAGAVQTGQCPNGGVHVYDITGDLEENPVKVGYWNIAEIRKADGDLFGVETAGGIGRCTAHVFELHPDEQLMTIAYYNGGVRVVDISGLVGVALGEQGIGMKQVAFARFADADTWAVKAPYVDRDGTFHLYGNDQRRGMDIYEVDLSAAADVAAAAVPTGTWMTPAEALTFARANPVDLTDYTPYCLLGARSGG
ncbi:MAG: hypothetical protein R3343_03615 [Nitriliruptorales bacterium]|nr:hypothetical protein [Nitriliruptorales bacterium]